jgi:AraC family transcriptional regulator of adaptative response / DNA-3-methyladenine glycosylase II
VVEGALDFTAPAEDVASALEALPGIGAWTAQYVALRALCEPDAFPAADLVLRRAAAAGGPPLSAAALTARAEAWRPWRGYAVLHLWRAAC